MLIDTHIHVGQFCDFYFAPSVIHKLMEQMQVDNYAVSSTTMCEENYVKVLSEMHELIALDGDKVLPVMWITPEGLKGNIAWFLESDIKWRLIKIHPFLNQTEWNPQDGLIKEVVDIARELQVPLLIHTGNEDCCQCGKFESLIANNSDVTFILAHGRPLHQVIPLLKTYRNAYADSAFMPIEDMRKLINEGLSHKLLWGTDMCIPKHFFPEEDMAEYYQHKLASFQKVCTHEQFEQVTLRNAAKVFNIQITD